MFFLQLCFYFCYLPHCFFSPLKTPFKHREFPILILLFNPSIEFLLYQLLFSLSSILSFYLALCHSCFIGVKGLVSLFCLLSLSLVWEFSHFGEQVGLWRLSLVGLNKQAHVLDCITFSECIFCESLWRLWTPPHGAVSHLHFPGFQLCAGSPVLAPCFPYLGLKPQLLTLLAVEYPAPKSHIQFCAPVYLHEFWHSFWPLEISPILAFELGCIFVLFFKVYYLYFPVFGEWRGVGWYYLTRIHQKFAELVELLKIICEILDFHQFL